MLLKLNWFYRHLWMRLGLSPSLLPHVPISLTTGCPQRAVNSAVRDTLVAERPPGRLQHIWLGRVNAVCVLHSWIFIFPSVRLL